MNCIYGRLKQRILQFSGGNYWPVENIKQHRFNQICNGCLYMPDEMDDEPPKIFPSFNTELIKNHNEASLHNRLNEPHEGACRRCAICGKIVCEKHSTTCESRYCDHTECLDCMVKYDENDTVQMEIRNTNLVDICSSDTAILDEAGLSNIFNIPMNEMKNYTFDFDTYDLSIDGIFTLKKVIGYDNTWSTIIKYQDTVIATNDQTGEKFSKERDIFVFITFHLNYDSYFKRIFLFCIFLGATT